jgi:hypothetical protein
MDIATNQRVLKIINHYNLSYNDFAKSAGLQKQAVYQWKDQTSYISEKSIIKILLHYPDINANWLIRGEGEMLLHQDDQVMFRFGKEDIKEPKEKYTNATVEALLKTTEQQSLMIKTMQQLIDALQGNNNKSQTG